ncbi:MAG: hypothetical protein AOA65_1882 [Candidatus Bathyarchaeota archaeon BA1]|nr:MAG: hypothetical protein AOA65_1882 [Candidatus Bathyarchaeota archaeon BA1]
MEDFKGSRVVKDLLSNVASAEPCVRAVLLFGSMARERPLRGAISTC